MKRPYLSAIIYDQHRKLNSFCMLIQYEVIYRHLGSDFYWEVKDFGPVVFGLEDISSPIFMQLIYNE